MSQKGRTLVDSTSVTHPDQSFMETESGAVVARAGGREDRELVFDGDRTSVLRGGRGLEESGRRLYNNMNALNATELHTLKNG